MVFIPLVVETLGAWEEQADVQIKRLGAALARQTGQGESDKIRHVFQSLAKDNAALFLNRVGEGGILLQPRSRWSGINTESVKFSSLTHHLYYNIEPF
jgi:hypothetical protein